MSRKVSIQLSLWGYWLIVALGVIFLVTAALQKAGVLGVPTVTTDMLIFFGALFAIFESGRATFKGWKAKAKGFLGWANLLGFIVGALIVLSVILGWWGVTFAWLTGFQVFFLWVLAIYIPIAAFTTPSR